MRRLKLTLSYHGAEFSGWQSQADGNAVQDHLEAAFRKILDRPVRVHGSGRTDSGVHALGQVAHVDLPDARRSPERWLEALNGLLPRAIRIVRSRFVPDSFHARFSARGKVYRYQIWAAPVASPFEADRSWHVRRPLDGQALARAAFFFQGTHDFAGFAANRGKKEESTVRTIHRMRVTSSGARVRIELDGNGFLYKMARLMVGMMVQCATGKLPVTAVEEALRNPAAKHPRLVAPAEGLFLVRVRY